MRTWRLAQDFDYEPVRTSARCLLVVTVACLAGIACGEGVSRARV